jgi:subtilase family serine protease
MMYIREPNRLKKSLWVTFLFMLLCSSRLFAQTIDWQPGAGIKVNPKNPQAGETVNFTVTLNSGASHARGYMVVGAVDGKPVFRARVPLLQAHQSHDMSFRWKAIPGRHEVAFRIVGSRTARTSAKPISRTLTVTTESRAARPTASRQQVPAQRPVTAQATTRVRPTELTAAGLQQPVCEGAPLPDLAISGINVSGSGRAGESHSVSVTVVNRGQCASGPFSVTASMQVQADNVGENIALGSKSQLSLNPCTSAYCNEASRSVSFAFLPAYNHALYRLEVEADSQNSINEFNEKNNKIAEELRIDTY